MSRFIQFLEQRMLMSVTSADLTADYQNVVADAKATRAALTSRRDTAVAFRNEVIDGMKVVDTKSNRAANNRLAATLIATGDRNYDRNLAAETALITAAESESVLGAAYGKGLINHPTSALYQKLVTKDITALNTTPPTKLTNLQTQLTNAVTAIDAVYTEISTANPSLSSEIQTGETSVATKTTAFIAAASQITVDTAQLATDLSSIANA